MITSVFKRIMVAGMPASGKSTLIEDWVERYKRIGVKVNVVDDYKVLLEVCPKGIVSEKYYYDEHGALILRDEFREEIMEKQYRRLRDIWRSNDDYVVIMELANPDLFKAVSKYFSGMSQSMLIVLRNEFIRSKERNSEREKWRQIPESFMRMFDEESRMSEDRARELFEWAVIIENNSSSEELMKKSEELWVSNNLVVETKGN